LGKMLCQAASCWELPIYALDTSIEFPAGPYCKGFQEGSFKNYEDVVGFGRQMDVLTIEIEHVNTDALRLLQAEGKTVHPDPDALDIIKDKGLNALKKKTLTIPFVQKSRTAGYDGKGVAVIQKEADLKTKLLDGPCMIEDLVEMDKEIAVVVARNERGEIQTFDPVEMEFNPIANLVEFLICPSTITAAQAQTCTDLAKKIIAAYDICGLLAVEFFLDTKGNILVNEVAPRPHNSGHHTIDSAECLAIEGVKIHLYGKAMTKPFRKMGHATIIADTIEAAKEKARKVQTTLIIKTKEG